MNGVISHAMGCFLEKGSSEAFSNTIWIGIAVVSAFVIPNTLKLGITYLVLCERRF
jgi:hypothetical protein